MWQDAPRQCFDYRPWESVPLQCPRQYFPANAAARSPNLIELGRSTASRAKRSQTSPSVELKAAQPACQGSSVSNWQGKQCESL